MCIDVEIDVWFTFTVWWGQPFCFLHNAGSWHGFSHPFCVSTVDAGSWQGHSSNVSVVRVRCSSMMHIDVLLLIVDNLARHVLFVQIL